MKKLILALAFLLLASVKAEAQAVCGGYPFTFVNGQVANATQVNGNFNWVRGCLNNTNTANFTSLRANTALFPWVIVDGAVSPADGLGGVFIYNPLDTTSPDNGTTIIVDAAGHRWYRQGGNSATILTSVAQLQALPISGFAAGYPVLVFGHFAAGDSPPVLYILSKSSCSLNNGNGDGGGQLPASAGNNCWIIGDQTIWDPRWWGALGDVVRVINTVTTTSGTGTVQVTGGAFTSADVGKLITVTDFIDTTNGNGPSYQGTIQSVTDASHVVVTPNVGFTLTNANPSQSVVYGHDDTASSIAGVPTGPINSMIKFLQGLRLTTTNPAVLQPAVIVQTNFAGLNYGVCAAPVLWALDGQPANGRLVALCSAHMPISGTNATGVFAATGVAGGATGNAGSLTGTAYFDVDAGLLPVNAIYANVNATTHWGNMRAFNWLGHDNGVAQAVTGTSGSFQVTVPNGAAFTVGMVSHDQQGNVSTGNSTRCSGGAGGMPQRAIIVAIVGNTLTFNKALTANCTANGMTFYNDASGFVEPKGAGIHAHDINSTQIEIVAMQNVPANHYGYAFYFDGDQANMRHTVLGGGAAVVFIGPDGNGLGINDFSQIFAQQYTGIEPNSAAIVISDGAGLLELDHVGISGVIQLWHVTTAANFPNIQASHIGASFNAGISDQFTPSNWLQMYTFVANTPIAAIQITADWAIGTSLTAGVTAFPACFISVGGGSWNGMNGSQQALICNTFNFQTSGGGGSTGPFATPGASLLTYPLIQAETQSISITTAGAASKTFNEVDSPNTYIYNGTGNATWTIPGSISGNTQTWAVKLLNRSASTLTLQADANSRLCVSGTCTLNGNASLTLNVYYRLECPINPGTAPVCYLTPG